MYLPPEDTINKEFLKKVFADEKKLLSMDEVKTIIVPKYEELSVKNLYNQCMEDEVLQLYLPEIGNQGKQIDRTFFYNVVHTIYPEFLDGIIKHALTLRHSPQNNEEKKDYILISNDWYSKLMEHPYISKKSGKTVHLLKASTKIYKGRRQKEKQQLGTSLKRFKHDDGEQSVISQQNYTQSQQQQMNAEYGYEQSEDQSPQRQLKYNI